MVPGKAYSLPFYGNMKDAIFEAKFFNFGSIIFLFSHYVCPSSFQIMLITKQIQFESEIKLNYKDE